MSNYKHQEKQRQKSKELADLNRQILVDKAMKIEKPRKIDVVDKALFEIDELIKQAVYTGNLGYLYEVPILNLQVQIKYGISIDIKATLLKYRATFREERINEILNDPE